MMKIRVIAAALVLFAGLSVAAKAGEVSKSALGSMGFGSMQKMTDNDGLAVRGKGGRSSNGTSASAWGSGTANFANNNGSATETTGYRASSKHGHGGSSAVGGNIALAGQVSSGKHGSTNYVIIGAAGGSFASAH